MATNLALSFPVGSKEVYLEKVEHTIEKTLLTKRERIGLKVIYNHSGKKFVYETYLKTNPEMARKYLRFISRNTTAIYIKWDNNKQMFVT